MFCEQCGSKLINENDVFCPYCGAKRNIVVPSASQIQVDNSVTNQPVSDNNVVNQPVSDNNVVNQPVSDNSAANQIEADNSVANQPVFDNSVANQTEVGNSTVRSEQIQPANEEVWQDETKEKIENTEIFNSSTPNITYTEKELTQTLADDIAKISKEETSVNEQPKIPEGFVLDQASGWFYKSKGKQLPNGSYVNEITWFDPTTGGTKVVDYPLSEQQVKAMLQASGNQGRPTQTVNPTPVNQNQSTYQGQTQNPYQGQAQNPNQAQATYQGQAQNPYQASNQQYPNQNQRPYPNYAQGQNQGFQGQPSAYPNQQSVVVPPKKKKKTGLIIGIVAAVVVLGLGFCTWKFEWYRLITGDKVATSNMDDKEDPTEAPTPTEEATPSPSPTPTPTPTPENPLGTLNEDYIVIGGQEFETTVNTLYLDSMGLTNEDIEPLQYMKDLKFLYLSDNEITDLKAIEGLTNLESLDVSKNEIYDVNSISKLTNLDSLYLDNTQVSDLSPLTSLTNLQALGITYTKVFDLSPLTSIPSIMYLYIANSEVEDFSPLSSLPNLYMCDVDYNTNNPGVDNGNGGQLSGSFEFTEADNMYFQPLTDNYLIAVLPDSTYEQMVLFSYDQDGKCVQMRFRMDVGYDLSSTKVEDYTSLLGDSINSKNFNIDGSVMYFDYLATEEEFNFTKEQVLEEMQADNYQIIANVE